MRTLLISVNTEQVNMPVLPMGLACVAAAAQGAGHEVRVVNLTSSRDEEAVLKEVIADFRPGVIGVSARNIDDQNIKGPRFLLDSVKKAIALCRGLTEAPIVLGGAGYSMYAESALEYLGGDMGIQGEGEDAFVTLLERMERGAPLAGIPGLVLPGGAVEAARLVRKLDRFPLPIPNVHISIPSDLRADEVWLPFQTRRGCPMNCSFCSTPAIEGRMIRKRSPRLVVESLARFVDAGFRRFFFVDSVFNFPPSYAKELCREMIAARLGISWEGIVYPWKVDEELVAKMAEAGCVEAGLGFESGSARMLRAMNKRYDLKEVLRISELLKKYGIRRMGFLLLGGPGESKETVRESLAFADSLDPEAGKVTTGIRIYPYTPIAEIARKERIIAPDDDLLLPTFYLRKELDGWLQETVAEWGLARLNWMV